MKNKSELMQTTAISELLGHIILHQYRLQGHMKNNHMIMFICAWVMYWWSKPLLITVIYTRINLSVFNVQIIG